MKKEKYYPPEHAKGQFHCPYCGVYAKQRWSHLYARGDGYTEISTYGGISLRSNLTGLTSTTGNLTEEWTISICEHCNNMAIWKEISMIFPKKIVVEQPNQDLSDDIKKDYLEAANIFNNSSRASAAILRLALQKLCKQLGEKGEDINYDIGEMTKKGLNPLVQKSLDSLRITGNNAVHPGKINLEEKPEKVSKLFELINFIAEKMITEPKEIDNFYDDLPENYKKAIEKRDDK